MACRYFSCSRLLDESEDEAGAKSRTHFSFKHKIITITKIYLNYRPHIRFFRQPPKVFFVEHEFVCTSGINNQSGLDKLQFYKQKNELLLVSCAVVKWKEQAALHAHLLKTGSET